MALFKATIETIWLRQLLQDISFHQVELTTIYSNSQSVIALSANPKFHSRNKHANTQYHFTRLSQANTIYIYFYSWNGCWYFDNVSTKTKTFTLCWYGFCFPTKWLLKFKANKSCLNGLCGSFSHFIKIIPTHQKYSIEPMFFYYWSGIFGVGDIKATKCC